MAATANELQAFNEVKAGVTEIKELVQNSLNLQANGGYHVFNLAIGLEAKLAKLEAALNEEPAV